MKFKLFILVSSFFLFNTEISAQSRKNLKLYAYHQSILPGIQKQVLMDDSGNAYQTENQSNPNYLIFLEYRPSMTVHPLEVWIDGKGYSLKIKSVESTPIEMTDTSIPDHSKIIILVPSTKKTVLSISLNGLLEDQSKSFQFSELESQTIYLIYKKSCKRLHKIKTLIIPLPSIPMM